MARIIKDVVLNRMVETAGGGQGWCRLCRAPSTALNAAGICWRHPDYADAAVSCPECGAPWLAGLTAYPVCGACGYDSRGARHDESRSDPGMG